MSIKLADTLKPMADFPAVMGEDLNLVKADGTEKNLQKMYEDGELGGSGLPEPEDVNKLLISLRHDGKLKWLQIDKTNFENNVPTPKGDGFIPYAERTSSGGLFWGQYNENTLITGGLAPKSLSNAVSETDIDKALQKGNLFWQGLSKDFCIYSCYKVINGAEVNGYMINMSNSGWNIGACIFVTIKSPKQIWMVTRNEDTEWKKIYPTEPKLVEITYADFVAKRNAGELNPDTFYMVGV